MEMAFASWTAEPLVQCFSGQNESRDQMATLDCGKARPTDQTDVALGARIRQRRRELGLTQGDLGARLGISYQQVQKYERGADRVSASTLIKIARHLDRTVASLVGEEDGAQNSDFPSLLAVPGALHLIETYARINPPKTRRHLIDLLADFVGPDPCFRRRGD